MVVHSTMVVIYYVAGYGGLMVLLHYYRHYSVVVVYGITGYDGFTVIPSTMYIIQWWYWIWMVYSLTADGLHTVVVVYNISGYEGFTFLPQYYVHHSEVEV